MNIRKKGRVGITEEIRYARGTLDAKFTGPEEIMLEEEVIKKLIQQGPLDRQGVCMMT